MDTIKKVISFGIFFAVLGFSPLAKADLIDYGSGLIYDTELDITWYDQTFGATDIESAQVWAEGLSAGGVTGWRLPSALDQDGNPPTADAASASGELGHLYYTELGNVQGSFPYDDWLASTNSGPFSDLYFSFDGGGGAPAPRYWTDTFIYALDQSPPGEPPVWEEYYWIFSFWAGNYQESADGIFYDTYGYYGGNIAIAVHDGNVGATAAPEPSTLLILGTGLVGVVGATRRRLKQ